MTGACPQCGEELALDQRYCIGCGQRVEAPLAPSYLPGAFGAAERGEVRRGFPIPPPVAALIAAATLGFGVVMGTAISPNLSSLVAGERVEGPTVVQAPPAEQPKQKRKPPKPGGGSSGGLGDGITAPSFGGGGFFGSSGDYGYGWGTGGTGSGGGGKKKPKPEPKPKYTYVSGTVVHKNPVAGSYSLAAGEGLLAVHAKTLPSIGAKLKVPVRKLANGTLAEDADRQKLGTASAARFVGVVTYSKEGVASGDPDIYSVSGRGASVLVFGPGAVPAPAVGTLVTTDVEIRTASTVNFPPPEPPGPCADPGAGTAFPSPPLFPGKQLWQTAVQTSPEPVTGAVIETVTQWTCPASAPSLSRGVIASDDIRYAQSNLDLPIAAAVDPGQLAPGKALMASVKISGGAITEIDGARSDQGIKGADSGASGQGTLSHAIGLARVARTARATERRIAKVAARRARR